MTCKIGFDGTGVGGWCITHRRWQCAGEQVRGRVLPDPGSRILTRLELDAALRVLRSLRTPVCASTLLDLPDVDARMYIELARAGYVESWGEPARHGFTKPGAPFRWARVGATEAGLEYLRQIESAE